MDVSITQVPIWLSVLFVVCFSTFPIFLVANAAKKALENESLEKGRELRKKIIIFYWSYLLLIGLLSLAGFFEKNTLPPRIILASTLPLFLFYLIYVQKTKWFKSAFKHIKLEQLIFIHIFRFVGVFFFLVYTYNALPKEFAFIGGAGDIITAILVVPVVIALKKKLKIAIKLAWIWNFVGILDIVSVLTTAIILTRAAIENNDPGVQQFGTFPFSWIPAFAPATIIFLHLLIFKKLRNLS